MEHVDYRAVLADLKQRKQKLEAEYRSQIGELNAAISAIEKLIPPSLDPAILAIRESLRPISYRGMSISAAAEEFLQESGTPKSTLQIWTEISARGVESKSKHPLNTTYAVLLRKPEVFVRRGKKAWALAKWSGSRRE